MALIPPRLRFPEFLSNKRDNSIDVWMPRVLRRHVLLDVLLRGWLRITAKQTVDRAYGHDDGRQVGEILQEKPHVEVSSPGSVFAWTAWLH
jgi:hypothetical protein